VQQQATLDSRGAPERVRLRLADPISSDILDFLYLEAEYLDQDAYESWQALLAEDLEYRMPVRATVYRADGNGFIGQMGHFDDDYASIVLRIRRVRETTTAWAEDPPSRARRYVTNVRVWQTVEPGEFEVSSYLFLTRSRWDSPDLEFLAAERRDLLRLTGDGWRLARREILVDQSKLGTINMALFL
jgi:3-phenylpropionate/cinnamic acid dioxygenase small subunit